MSLFLVFYMAARMNMSLNQIISPAVLKSRLTTVTTESCLVINMLYFKLIQPLHLSLVRSDGKIFVLNHAVLNSNSNHTGIKTEFRHKIQPGTYSLNISAKGKGDLYVAGINVKDLSECGSGKLKLFLVKTIFHKLNQVSS